MFVLPQQNMTWTQTATPVQAPMLDMPTAVAAMPTAVAVLLNSTDTPASIPCMHGADMEVMGPVEISNAVWSLYEDQVKPYGRILRKRLAEMAMAKGLPQVEVDPCCLRQACESYWWFSVKDELAGEWACLLPGMPEAFIDATDPTDVYPAHLWASFAAYLDSLAQGDEAIAKMPGGRYACAQELASRQLYFFASYKLGQICHIVQLAISQKHYLGYSEGCLVPYAMSQSMVKERRATQQKPATTRGSRPLATWPKVREVLHQVLHKAWLQKQQSVPLSNVKRIFRSQYKVELSETALGYAKLSELLRDAFVSDLCIVELRQSGYVMIPRPEAVGTPTTHSTEHDFSTGDVTPRCEESDCPASPENSTSTERDCTDSPKSDTAPKRRPQLLIDLDDDSEAPAPSSTDSGLDSCPEPDAIGSLSQWPLSPSQISEVGCIPGLVQRTFIHHPPPPPTPSKGCGAGFCTGARVRSLSVPKSFGSAKCSFADALHSLVYLHRPVHSMPASEADDASSKCDSPVPTSLEAAHFGPIPWPQDVDA